MSLESKIEELTVTIKALIVIIRTVREPMPNPVFGPMGGDTFGGQLTHEAAKPQSQWTEAECRATAARQAAALGERPNSQSSEQPTTDTSTTSSPELSPVSYDDVKRITIEVSKIEKAKAVAGLARFGAKNAKDLTESQWPEYVEYMTKVAAGEIDLESGNG